VTARLIIVVTFGLSALACAFFACRALKRESNATDWTLGGLVCALVTAWGIFG
jgi:hypothetical protein